LFIDVVYRLVSYVRSSAILKTSFKLQRYVILLIPYCFFLTHPFFMSRSLEESESYSPAEVVSNDKRGRLFVMSLQAKLCSFVQTVVHVCHIALPEICMMPWEFHKRSLYAWSRSRESKVYLCLARANIVNSWLM
jgi:hypothetical protein